MERPKKRAKKGPRKRLFIVYITVTVNNSFVLLVDPRGRNIRSFHTGLYKWRGPRRRFYHHNRNRACEAGEYLRRRKVRQVHLYVRGGARYRRRALVRGLRRAGLHFASWKNTSKLPFNGCRKPKGRRR
jgi:small subunit ribosomal protein S11